MLVDFLIVLFCICFLVCFVLTCFGIAKQVKYRKKLEQKRKERNERFATFDQHFANGEYFVKQASFDNDVFASIEEEI
ncbi:MAG: hypothetical protein IKA90_06580 [Clostridia bacterium]|nr:hypothetical protein [Clostridia bacterium]